MDYALANTAAADGSGDWTMHDKVGEHVKEKAYGSVFSCIRYSYAGIISQNSGETSYSPPHAHMKPPC